MTEFRVVSVAELKPVLDVLNGLSWPVAFDDFPAIFERLGWEKQRRKGGLTSLPVSLQIVSVGEIDGEISRIDVRVADTLAGTSSENSRIVQGAFPGAVTIVSECMQAKPTGTPWVDAGVVWDLPDGRQVRLIQGDDTISLDYWSKTLADTERHEQSHGVDPSNNLADRE